MVRFKTIFGLRIPLDEGDNNSATCPTATCFSDQGVLQIILWICKESFEETHIFSLYFKIQKIHIMYIYDIHMQIILFMYTTSANLSTTLHSSSLESWGSTNLICLFQDPRTNAQVLGAQVPGVSKPSVTGMLKGWGSRSWGDWWWEWCGSLGVIEEFLVCNWVFIQTLERVTESGSWFDGYLEME